MGILGNSIKNNWGFIGSGLAATSVFALFRVALSLIVHEVIVCLVRGIAVLR